MYAPLNFDKINRIEGSIIPSTEKVINNYTYNMWYRALFQRAMSKIKIGNLPEEWEKEEVSLLLYYVLFVNGYGVVANDNKFGTFFQPCTLSGYNFYYMPTVAIVTNPLMNSKEYEIHKDCEIVKLTPDYMGIHDILHNYSKKLSLASESIDVSLTNSKVPYILGGKTKGMVQSLKKIVDKMNNGETSIFYNNIMSDASKDKEPYQHIELFSKDSYIVHDLLEDFSLILSHFDNEIGIKNNNYEKKERLLQDEINSNNEDTLARCNIWLKSLKDSFSLVNKMFGFNITVELNEVEQNEPSEINTNRTL